MRIVDRKTFLSLPAGTVYAKWGSEAGDPSELFYGEVSVKGETVHEDWVDIPFLSWPEDCSDSMQWADAMEAARNGTPTAPLDIGQGGRDGLFDRKQMFAVYEREEVVRLLALLTSCLGTAYPEQG